MRVVAWGTYDTGKPRVRLLLAGLRVAGVEVEECHEEPWRGIEDKSQLGRLARLRLFVRLLTSYPVLILRYLRLPRHDAVLVGYLGHLDVVVLRPFAKLRGVPVVWDAFVSLYDTVVDDRRLVGNKNPVAVALYLWEWLACRLVDLILLDTRAHADYFVRRFRVSTARTASVFVGAETEVFSPATADDEYQHGERYTVLFYGQFIPLHGVDIIVRAAKLCDAEPIRWVLIGRGQLEATTRNLVRTLEPQHLEWVEWVPYEELPKWIRGADIGLGIFGQTDKAQRVIPNKAFQILASARHLVTADTPAIRELATDDPCITLVPPADPEALARAVRELIRSRGRTLRDPCRSPARDKFRLEAIGASLRQILETVVDAR